MSEETKTTENSGVITIKKDTLWKYSAIVLAALVIILLIFFVLPGKSTTGNVVNTGAGTLPAVGERVEVEIGDAPILGDEDAPVQIVEFFDFFCGFCQRHSQQTLPLIKSNYIDSGDVSYVAMNFLRVSPIAANAALCAREIGGDEAYWSYHDALFELGPQGITEQAFEQIALNVGVAGSDFDECLSDERYNSLIQEETSHAQSLGVSGTPGFFVNGRAISGACPYSVFDQAIEAELNGEDWAVSSCQFRLL